MPLERLLSLTPNRVAARVFDLASSALLTLADRPRSVRRSITIAIDVTLTAASAFFALYLRTGAFFWFGWPLLLLIVISLALWMPIAWSRRFYSSLVRSTGGRTLLNLLTTAISFSAAMCVVFMVITVPGVPRTMGLLQPIVMLACLAGVRLLARYAFVEFIARGRRDTRRRRVCIYGAGRAGQQLANALRHEPQMELIAFVDDDRRLHRQILDGVTILADGDHARNFSRLEIDEVLIAMPSASRARRRAIVEYLSQQNVLVRSLPSMGGIIEGNVQVSDLREIQIEELLGREAVPPNEVLLQRNIAGKVVLVSGAGGSIGSELSRQIVNCRPSQLILVEQSEFALYLIEEELREAIASANRATTLIAELCDVADANSVNRVINRYKPHTIFHAAAYKHVPLVEKNPISGIRNNVFGTLRLTQAAESAGVDNFILVSTDKAVRPTNIMGATKRVCEMILQARAASGSKTRFSMVRFGNVLGSSGSVVPRFKDQIAAGGPITVTDRRMTRYFMTIPEAAQLVIQAGAMANGGEVFFLEMGRPVRIVDLAVTMVHLCGLSERTPENPDGDIEIVEVGLRPGEKLYEELLLGQNPERTTHERITKAHETYLSWAELDPFLAELGAALVAGDVSAAMAVITSLVPEYSAKLSPAAHLAAIPVR